MKLPDSGSTCQLFITNAPRAKEKSFQTNKITARFINSNLSVARKLLVVIFARDDDDVFVRDFIHKTMLIRETA